MKHMVAFFWSLNFWFFVAVKAGGTSFAAWSWWWLLISIVPNLSLVVKHFGL
jgi:hypothetical protein